MAGATITRPGADRRPLLAYLRVQRDRERQMIALLNRTYDRITRELHVLEARPGLGAAVRRDQLLLTQIAIKRELSGLWMELGRTVLAGKADAAAAAMETMIPLGHLRSVMPKADVDYLLRSAKQGARSGFAAVEARRKLSQIPLAESVYKNRELTSGKVDEIVDQALARGASARELARDVRRYVRPDVRGGVRYAAMRLGRTELNNSFHAMQIESGVKTPWTTGLLWNLSGSHPKPDECNEYADEDHEGLGAGIYTPENVPPKPHPNCLCYTTAEVVDRDTFIAQYQTGAYDDIVNELMSSGTMTFR